MEVKARTEVTLQIIKTNSIDAAKYVNLLCKVIRNVSPAIKDLHCPQPRNREVSYDLWSTTNYNSTGETNKNSKSFYN